jgi:hypothetical protein
MFLWLRTLPVDLLNYHAYGYSTRNMILYEQALPIVVGWLWFGGHALVGAFFVSKCNSPHTAPVPFPETPFGE